VRRVEKPLKSSEILSSRGVCIVPFESQSSGPGVSSIKLEDIRALHTPASTNLFTNLNSLWHVAGRISVTGQPRPNWSGFMQTVCQGEHSGASTIEMLEIIDLNPSDDNCIYSTLLYVISQAKSRFFPVPNVTFDQPLYIKAVDIAMKSNLDIVIRLGGFHTLMSFLGSIGNMMRGSGLEEVMGLIFGSNTMEHVLSGKAYARAVRGHFILHSALTDLLLDYLKNPISDESNSSPVAASSEKVSALAGILSSADVSALTCLYNDVLLKKLWVNDTDNPVVTCSTLNHVTTELNELCTALIVRAISYCSIVAAVHALRYCVEAIFIWRQNE